jgi:DNA invertase Pin-like site-specific DNA recombinase
MTENKSVRKCAIYCRVSTDEQNPMLQVKELETFASLQNIKVYKVYIDRISGSKDSRPALNELMKDGYNKRFNVVVVWKLDRLGRSLSHLIKLVNNFDLWGIDFICVSQNIDTSSAGGKLIFHIMGAMAEFERTLISERTKLGLKDAKNVGKRGKDKRPRKKGGYYQRYQKKGGVDFGTNF